MRILNTPYITRLRDKGIITIEVDKQSILEAERVIGDVAEGEYSLSVNKARKKRSLDANAFAWVLIKRLAEHYSMEPLEVYRQAISTMHTYEVIPIRKDAVDKWESIWKAKGDGWIVTRLGDSKIEGYVNLRCFYGSSTFDTKEMTTFIDGLIQECEVANIYVEDERERLLKEWEALSN